MSTKITLTIVKATVVRLGGPDHVTLLTDLPSPVWPYKRGHLSLHFDVASQNGPAYVMKHFGVRAGVVEGVVEDRRL